MAQVNNLKKSRKVTRGLFTKYANGLDALLSADSIDRENLEVTFELLTTKFDELKILNSEIYELVLDSATEDELTSEIEGGDDYNMKYATSRIKYEKLQGDSATSGTSVHSRAASSTHNSVGNTTTGMHKFKLPRIEFKHYDGSVKDWLSFWAQFKKIHNDTSIDKSDKIEYLIQATVPGSRARRLVESYPAMGENYDKIIDSMQSRFGREDLQIEVYIRELLKLILSNSVSKQKFEIAVLYDQIETQLRALETLGISSDKCSAMLFPLIESCLPHELIRVWQRSTFFNDSPFPENTSVGSKVDLSVSSLEARLKNLMSFLRQEVENEQRIDLATEGFGMNKSTPTTKDSRENHAGRVRDRQFSQNSGVPTATGLMNCDVATCVFCSGSHDSASCFKAQKMSHEQRREALVQKKACYRCLKVGHQSKRCRGRLRCIICQRSHVVLMCPDAPKVTENKPTEKPTNSGAVAVTREVQREQTLANHTSTQVFLQTIRVNLIGVGRSRVVRALIDSGSQRSYILKATASQLGYRPKRCEKIVHCLFGGREVLINHNCYDITISRGNATYTFEVLDETTICGDIVPVLQGQWTGEMEQFDAEISDAGKPGPIELLLGADVAGSLYTGGRRELKCGLFAIETHFGWTLMGKMPTTNERSEVVMTTLNLFIKDVTISDLWELEVIGIKDPSDKRSKEENDIAAKELFLQTIAADKEGRYEVQLPWLDGHPPLPTNYKIAKKRLEITVSKLKKEGLLEQYDQIFQEWEKEGIIEVVGTSNEGDYNSGHYLPHRPVIKEKSTTTKIRPVFDASAHETGKPALNHCLEKGPNLIELIPSMLLRFRENKLGVTADIRKAFLQIGLRENERDFLRFLWVDSQGQEIVLRHKRVVFGVSSSPFLLGATLEYHLSLCLTKVPITDIHSRETIERLSRSFYVDNCVASLHDEQDLFNFIKKATAVMAEGHFELRGWEHSGSNISEACPLLGLNWDARRDVLSLNPEFLSVDLDLDPLVVSKRLILSITQKVFDPIGYTCPSVLIPKLLLQGLWKERLTWDQPVDDVTAQAFKTWVRDLHYLIKIEIPRWVWVTSSNTETLTLHTFCDACNDAYACVIFLRAVIDEKVAVFLLAAKARVAPLKRSNVKMTIPRLELLAASIGARLYTQVVENLGQQINSFFWSDSSTVVSWIQRKEEWGVFVWNRVTEIRSLTKAERWRHLPGIHNPADLPSRGCLPKQLFDSKWWEGPKWLYGPPQEWPNTPTTCNEEEIVQEKKKLLVTTLLNTVNLVDWHLEHFSQYNKTIRMIAWIFRYFHNCKHVKDRHKGELKVQEIENAEKFVFKVIQQKAFSGENDKSISCLNPFYDQDGLIRLKSRVSRREDTENYRFPIVLPAKDPVIRSLIMHMHVESCHVGTQGLLSILRERYWILGGRRTVRSVISRCVICRKFEVKPLVVESPPLPLDRVRDAIAFEVTGVDFAGPLFLKNGDKAWICLFTCAVYRAVHLELVTSMSTQSFLQAFRRFVSRRGRPKTIYSDNGTNFLGAENAMSQLNWDDIMRECSVRRITWRFNPPTAAWWGGFWERLIGVLKRLLRKMLGRARLEYEDLLTVLCDCEAVVNARPITYLSEDSKDLVALTPSMFLREQTECGLPDCDAIDRGSFCKKIRKMQAMREDLQTRFRAEYLGQLKLACGKRANREVTIGTIVLVGNDTSKRLDWPIAKVVEVLPSQDGQIRLVRVETSRGTLLRPLQRLYPLECDGDGYIAPDVLSQEEKTPDTLPQEEEMSPMDDGTVIDFHASSEAGTTGDHGDVTDSKVGAEVITMKTTRSGRTSRMPPRFCE